MKTVRPFLLLIFMVIVPNMLAKAQDKPLKVNGFNVKVQTLSNGKYCEFFDQNVIVEIGSILYNTETGKIVEFLKPDSSESKISAELVSRWLSIDPHADKYSSISPYVYCLNNPLKFIDPDGKDVEIVIGKPYTENGKSHPYGHVAIRVYGEGYNYVFEFGRYGKTWGLAGSKGEGIMNLYTDGSKYMKDEARFRESEGFNLSTTSEQDQKVIDYYTNMAKEGEVYNSGAVPGGGGTAYKLKKDYDVFKNNCTTKSAEGLEQIGENKIGKEYDPRDLLKSFESNYENLGFTKKTTYLEGGGTVVTYERQKKEEEQKKQEEQK